MMYKSNRADKKEAEAPTAPGQVKIETGKLAETKCSRDAAEFKQNSMQTNDKGAYKIYHDEKNDREQNTYYFERRSLTDAKAKQDSYAGVQQFYQRKDRIVGTSIPQEREYTQRRDEEIVNTRITAQRTDRDLGELPPDYDTLYPDQQ